MHTTNEFIARQCAQAGEIVMIDAAIALPALNSAPGYCKTCKDYTIAEPLFALPAKPTAQPKSFQKLDTENAQGIEIERLTMVIESMQALPVHIPDGMCIVPIEPTPEMIEAGCPCGEVIDHFDMRAAYRAMIAAIAAGGKR